MGENTNNKQSSQPENQNSAVNNTKVNTTTNPVNQNTKPVNTAASPSASVVSPSAANTKTAAFVSKLSDYEFDALKEVANIGSGNASIALSSIFKKKVNLSIPNLQVVNISNMSNEFNKQEGIVVGVFSRIQEGMDGNVFMFLPTTSALKFVAALKNEDLGTKQVLSHEDEDMLKKISSVLYSAYITGIANFFEQKILFSPPNVISTPGNTLLDSILVRMDKKENILIIDVTFEIEGVSIKGDFTLVLTMNSLSPMLLKIKQKSGQA